MRTFTGITAAAAVLAAVGTVIAPGANADSPARQRELTCSDGTVFVGEQVRQGAGRPPRVWRLVEPTSSWTAFSFHAATVLAPDGSVVESESWDRSPGVEHRRDLVVCGFVIPIGPLAGHHASFAGFFVG